MIHIPKIVMVLRLFYEEALKNDLFDPSKVSLESTEWRENRPTEAGPCNIKYGVGLYYIKNHEEKLVSKAFYLGDRCYIPQDSRWYHSVKNEYIYNEEVSHWMPLPPPPVE